jgi:cytochrome c-type biogenesis protein CcmF
MIAEIGLFCLILALFFSILLVVVPCIGFWKNNMTCQQVATRYVWAQFVCVGLAYLCLTVCFMQNDFTVSYVLLHSSLKLPWFYKFCAVWGGHEGSMLLWIMVLSAWMVAVCRFSQTLEHAFRVRVLVVLGMLSIGFLLFLLATSNPFARQFDVLDSVGRDLNPLLQDPGFLFHPPMLYMGYVGFSVAFSFAIAALWLGRVESVWSKWARPWTLAAWCCLTLGITLGSWWAYRELGWGGWWFWDPVENASFMPWLLGTALLHSLAVNEQRHQLHAWTLLLAIGAFSLSLIGTFLVRSGVLVSVHAFAVDPARGMFILLFLWTVIGGSLLLFMWRARALSSAPLLHAMSREGALLLNNVFLVAAMLTVLLGTVYPLLVDGLGLGKLSVGAPYFNTVFVPFMMPLLALMSVGVSMRWQRDSAIRVLKQLLSPVSFSLVSAYVCMCFAKKTFELSIFLGLFLAIWIIVSSLLTCFQRVKQRGFFVGQAFLGMIIAHIGVAMSVIGMVASSGFGLQEDIKMSPGEHAMVANYRVDFVSESSLTGPNYHGSKVCFKVTGSGKSKIIFPEKRVYDVGNMAMTDAAIDVNLFRDIYIALGEPLDTDAWSVRLYYKPFVRWIWAGGLLMMLGGVLALFDRRYRYAPRQHARITS